MRVDVQAFRVELAGLLAAMRAGAITDAGGAEKGRGYVVRGTEMQRFLGKRSFDPKTGRLTGDETSAYRNMGEFDDVQSMMDARRNIIGLMSEGEGKRLRELRGAFALNRAIPTVPPADSGPLGPGHVVAANQAEIREVRGIGWLEPSAARASGQANIHP